MKSISITDLRSNLKDVLSDVKAGQVIQITQRGKVIATVNPAVDSEDEEAFQERLDAYRNGISVHDDIVDSPLKAYDYVDDSLLSNNNIAAEPND